jgi:hypothetical protein
MTNELQLTQKPSPGITRGFCPWQVDPPASPNAYAGGGCLFRPQRQNKDRSVERSIFGNTLLPNCQVIIHLYGCQYPFQLV